MLNSPVNLLVYMKQSMCSSLFRLVALFVFMSGK